MHCYVEMLSLLAPSQELLDLAGHQLLCLSFPAWSLSGCFSKQAASHHLLSICTQDKELLRRAPVSRQPW